MSDRKDPEQVESELDRTVREVDNKWQGVILMEHVTDKFIYMPLTGFPAGLPFHDMCDVDLTMTRIPLADRVKKFELKIGEEEFGTDARFFMRVEEGCEKEFIDCSVNYLNGVMSNVQPNDWEKKYQNLAWATHDSLLKNYLMIVRKVSNTTWPCNPRQVFGANIKYAKDIVCYGDRTLVRELGPNSVATSRTINTQVSTDKGTPDTSKPDSPRPGTSTEVPSAVEPVPQATLDPGSPEGSAASVKQPPSAKKKTPAAKFEVTDEEIEAELENVHMKSDLGPKLQKLYDELPDSVDDIPDGKTDPAALKDFLIKLRPFENAYHKEANIGALPRIIKTTKMSPTVVKREMERLTELMQQKIKYKDDNEKKKWDEAKRRAIFKKKSLARREDKAKQEEADRQAREKELAAKKAKEDAEKAKDEQEKAKAAADRAKAKADRDAMLAKTRSEFMSEVVGEEEEAEQVQPEEVTDDQPQPDAGTRSDSHDSTQDETEAPLDQPPSAEGESDAAAKDSDKGSSSSEEVIRPVLSKSRAQPGPAIVPLKRPPPVQRSTLEDILARVGAINTRMSSIEKSIEAIDKTCEKAEKNVDRRLGKVVEAMELMGSDMKEMKITMNKQQMANELEMLSAEGEITKYMPFEILDEGAMMILNSEVAAKVLTAHVWAFIDSENFTNMTLSDVVLSAIRVVFSNNLRAALYIDSGYFSEPNTEGPKGWYRTKVPAIFLTIMERYILRRFTDATAVAKSPRTKKRTYQKIMSEHFQNIRIRYFKAKCNNAKTLDEMLNKRYDAQIEMFEKNYDPDRDGAVITPATLAQEKRWYVESKKDVTDVSALQETPYREKNFEFINACGDPTEDVDAIHQAINKVTSLQYGLPSFISDVMPVGPGHAPTPEEVDKALTEEVRARKGQHRFEALHAVEAALQATEAGGTSDPLVAAGGGSTSASRHSSHQGSPRRPAGSPPRDESPTKKARKSGTATAGKGKATSKKSSKSSKTSK